MSRRQWSVGVVFVVSGIVAGVACDQAGSDAVAGDAGGALPDAAPAADASPGDTGGCGLVVPASYDAPEFASNASVELGLRARFNAFVQPMKDAEASLAVIPTKAQLVTLFQTGTPSLQSITSAYYQGRIDALLGDFEAAAGKSWTPADPGDGGTDGGAPTGGKFGKYIFDERGTDLRQAVEKGMYAASFYNHASGLLSGPLTEAIVDRVLASYGAPPSFPGNDKGPAADGGIPDGGVASPDVLTAVYAKRRDKRDPQNPGLYLKLKAAFIKSRAAITRGAACDPERDAAIAEIRDLWEKTIFATVIFYLDDSAKKLGAAAPTTDDLANGLHAYGEAVSFVHGWRQLPQGARRVTDAQIDDLLAALGAPPTGPATSYRFVTDTATELGRLQQGITKVTAIYGFSPAEVEGFKALN
jgi:hypothetical protein